MTVTVEPQRAIAPIPLDHIFGCGQREVAPPDRPMAGGKPVGGREPQSANDLSQVCRTTDDHGEPSIARLNVELGATAAQAHALQAELTAAHAEIAQGVRLCAKLEAERAEADSARASIESDARALTAENQALRQSATEHASVVATVNSALQSAKQEIGRLAAEHEVLAIRAAGREELSADLEAARSELAQSTAECRRLAAERAEADSARHYAQSEIERLTAELGTVRQRAKRDAEGLIAERDALIVKAARAEIKAAAASLGSGPRPPGEKTLPGGFGRSGENSRGWFVAAVGPIPQQAANIRHLPLLTDWWGSRRVTIQVVRRRGRGSLMSLADRARDASQWEVAARFYRDAANQNPRNPAIWVQLGHALKESGRLREAESAYRLAIGLDGENHDTFVHLGHTLKLQMRTVEAASAYRRALDLAHDPEIRSLIEAECNALDEVEK